MSEKALVALANFVLIMVISTFAALPVMWCWNAVMPHVFKLPHIGWGQAWCLEFLAMNFIKGAPFYKL